MSNHKSKITKSELMATATQQHKVVAEFLNQDPLRSDLIEKLKETIGDGNELTILLELLNKNEPVTNSYIHKKTECSKATITSSAKKLHEYLTTNFSNSIEPLKAKRIKIGLKLKSNPGGVSVGYHLICLDRRKKYLDVSATKRLFEDLWYDFIKKKLREKIKEDAEAAFSAKLERRNDYQARDIEIGRVPDNKWQTKIIGQPTGLNESRKYDHNRIWKTFDLEALFLEDNYDYILTADLGNGKTTFLRHLQIEYLRKTDIVPVFIDASKIEAWNLENTYQLAKKLVYHFDLGLLPKKVFDFINRKIGKEIVFLVDGLDQINAGGMEYERLANHFFSLMNGKMIISSRPSAITNLEQERKFEFLRLKPFDNTAQKKYFGKFLKSAKKLAINDPYLISIPILAYMVRMLIENHQDQNIENRTQLYETFIDYIFKEYKHGKAKLSPMLRDQTENALGEIAYMALSCKEPHFQSIPLKFCFERNLLPNNLLGNDNEILTKSGLVNLVTEQSGISKKDSLFFIHQSFQEYFAAEHISKDPERIHEILSEKWNPKWKETIKFLTGIKDQEIIEQIYDGGRDNLIHSNLFLAADCCGELSYVADKENEILSKLEALLLYPYLSKDILVAYTRLKCSEATKRYFECLISKSPAISYAGNDIPSVAFNLLSTYKYKLLPVHVDKLIEYTCVSTKNSLNPRRLEIMYDLFTKKQLHKLIETDCENCSKFYIPVGEILYNSDNTDRSHINHIFSYIADEDKNVRLKALELLDSFAMSHQNSKIRDINFKNYQNNGKSNIITSKQIDKLKDIVDNAISEQYHATKKIIDINELKAQRENNRIINEICLIFSHLAGGEAVFRDADIDWIVGIFKKGSIGIKRIISEIIGRFKDYLSKQQVRTIFEIFKKTKNIEIKQTASAVICDIGSIASPDIKTELLSMLEIQEYEIQKNILNMFSRNTSLLTKNGLDEVISVLKRAINNAKTGKIDIEKNIDILKLAVLVLDRAIDKIDFEQANKVIDIFRDIPPQLDYSDYIRTIKTNMGDLTLGEGICALPANLDETQLEEVLELLNSPSPFAVIIGFNILIRQIMLPDKIIQRIFDLWQKSELVELLSKILIKHKKYMSANETEIITSQLQSSDKKVRIASLKLLNNIQTDFSNMHIGMIIGLMKEDDFSIFKMCSSILLKLDRVLPASFYETVIQSNNINDGNREEYWSYISHNSQKHQLNENEIEKIMKFIKSPSAGCRENAISMLKVFKQSYPPNLIDEIVNCLKDQNKNVQAQAAKFLATNNLTLNRKQIDQLLNAYQQELPNYDLKQAIISCSHSLTKHDIDILLELANKNSNTVKIEILDIMKLADHALECDHINNIKLMLGNSDDVSKQAYGLLKKMYSQGFELHQI